MVFESKFDPRNTSRFRVKSIVKSFRDLQVYQSTIQLSNDLISLDFLESEKQELKNITENIPKLIAESYGDKFDSREIACKKLTQSVTLISDIITKIDLLREKFAQEKDKKQILDKILLKYSYQKRKILNLRKAWNKVFEGPGEYGRK